ncbi:MAG: hypothetical protein O3C49_08055 [Proteobacteria bacterium]|nr:hypothetical protein [Pseudomonadota bacterium]
MPSNAHAQGGPVRAPQHDPTPVQLRWLKRGLAQPGGKLPIFDENGQRFANSTIQSCVRLGWAEPWFENPLKSDWVVCKLTHLGRVVEEDVWRLDDLPDLSA